MQPSPQTFVVTGTDTEIGKTVFSAGLCQALGASYWKPVQAGLEEGSDRETVARLAGCETLPEAYRLQTPCSPDLSASIDGVQIDPERLVPPVVSGPLVIEGAGGALVPLGPELLYADLFAHWQFPVILVARTTLGTINHSLLSIEALRTRQIPIFGIAFVGDAVEHSEATICRVGQVRRLGRLPRLEQLDADHLRAAFRAGFGDIFHA